MLQCKCEKKRILNFTSVSLIKYVTLECLLGKRLFWRKKSDNWKNVLVFFHWYILQYFYNNKQDAVGMLQMRYCNDISSLTLQGRNCGFTQLTPKSEISSKIWQIRRIPTSKLLFLTLALIKSVRNNFMYYMRCDILL